MFYNHIYYILDLSEPVDVYAEWVDEAFKANAGEGDEVYEYDEETKEERPQIREERKTVENDDDDLALDEDDY